jgi:hypothetical protein
MRIAVSDQEALDAQHIAAATGADHRHAALAVADQPDTSQDEGAHDDLGDIGFSGDEAAKVRALDADGARIGAGAAADQDLAVVEQVQFAGELARAVGVNDRRLALAAESQDVDEAFEHQEEIDAALAALEHIGPRRQRLLLAESRNARGHLLAQHGEGLGSAIIGIGGVQLGARQSFTHGHTL